MLDLTPDLPARYRHSALVTLATLIAQAEGDIGQRRATAERLPFTGQRAAAARVSLGFAEDRLGLLRDCQRFLRLPGLPPI